MQTGKWYRKQMRKKWLGNSKLGKCVEKKGAIGNNKGNLKVAVVINIAKDTSCKPKVVLFYF